MTLSRSLTIATAAFATVISLAIGGLGPLWNIYATQDIDELKQLPLKQSLTAAVWGLYYIQISAQQPAS